jgi:acetamidase/formamidase
MADNKDSQTNTESQGANGSENLSSGTEPLDENRRVFLKGAAASGGLAAAASLGILSLDYISTAGAQGLHSPKAPGTEKHYHLPANAKTVHWGYFSKKVSPVLRIDSGDIVTIETLTHQAGDDYERMIAGDPGAESVYFWDKHHKNVNRRGSGPMDAPNGAGGGRGVHILTGPIYIRGAEPGDILEVRILDIKPRPSANPKYRGKAFGTNLAAWWGFQYHDLLEEPKPREVFTIYELDAKLNRHYAKPVYQFRYVPQTDPFGVEHKIYDYPGVIIDHRTVQPRYGVLKDVIIPIRPHFGTIGLAPAEEDYVSSIPPAYFGGNIDNWRVTKGAVMYYPVAVPGALLSVGDPHASQGDSELCGTAIESSMTGVFQIILHKRSQLAGTSLNKLYYPLLENRTEWVIHGFSYPDYLKQLGPGAQDEIAKKSSIDRAMRDAFRKVRHFLMNTKGLTEDEAISLMSCGVDFGVTQVVDQNWGVHAILRKEIFTGNHHP